MVRWLDIQQVLEVVLLFQVVAGSGTVAGGSGNAQLLNILDLFLNFNGDEYVPKSAVPEIIGAASKQGAMAGKAQTFNYFKKF